MEKSPKIEKCAECGKQAESDRPRKARQLGICAKCWQKRLDNLIEKVRKA